MYDDILYQCVWQCVFKDLFFYAYTSMQSIVSVNCVANTRHIMTWWCMQWPFWLFATTRVGELLMWARPTHRVSEWTKEFAYLERRISLLWSFSNVVTSLHLVLWTYQVNIGSGASLRSSSLSPMETTTANGPTTTTDITKDNFIPLFNNRIADYKERRLRIVYTIERWLCRTRRKRPQSISWPVWMVWPGGR